MDRNHLLVALAAIALVAPAAFASRRLRGRVQTVVSLPMRLSLCDAAHSVVNRLDGLHPASLDIVQGLNLTR